MTVFEKNMSLIAVHHKELHDELSSSNDDDDTLFELPTPSGFPTLLYHPSGKPPVFFHHPNDPISEAYRLLEGHTFHGEGLTVLMGLGLGYLPMVIAEKMHRDHMILLVEAGVNFLRKALQIRDLTGILTDSRVKIFTAGMIASITGTLNNARMKVLSGKITKLIHPPSYNLFAEEYRRVETQIESTVGIIKSNYIFLKANATSFLTNFLRNLDELPNTAPVDAMQNAGAGKPIVIVAAGPSLDKNIRQLHRIKNRFPIIAVDAALKPLIMEEVQPDMVVSADIHPANLKKFQFSDPTGESFKTPLVFSPFVNHDIPPLFEGPKYIFNVQNRISQWALGLWNPVSTFPVGFSVAHFAFYLARALGSEPIIFLGLDLALSEKKHHAKNCNLTWRPDFRNNEFPLVPGIDGNMVPTLRGFLHMISIFESEIAVTPVKCIDATEGGALINGTTVMPLKDVIDEYGIETTHDFIFEFEEIRRKSCVNNSGVLSREISSLKDSAETIEGLCMEAKSVLETRHASSNKTVSDRIRSLTDQVHRHSDFIEIIIDQIPEVLVQQYENRFRVERAVTREEREALMNRNSRVFFDRLLTVTQLIQRELSGFPKYSERENIHTKSGEIAL